MNQHDRSAQCKRIGHSLILGAPIRKVGGIDGQHHARLFDDPLIGQKLGVRLLMEVDALQFRASREHIEVALPKLRCPFGSLLLMGYDADQPKGFILLPQNIDDLCSVQPHAGVAGHPKLRDTALAQFHDPLRHLQLHTATAVVLLVKAPREPQGMLTDHRTANILFHHSTASYCSLLAYN